MFGAVGWGGQEPGCTEDQGWAVQSVLRNWLFGSGAHDEQL